MKLERAALAPRREWLRTNKFSVACAIVGIVGVLLVAGIHVAVGGAFFSELPSPWLSVPPLVATVGLGAAALARREPGWRLVVLGASCAAAGLALGWLLALALIVVVSWGIIVVMAELL